MNTIQTLLTDHLDIWTSALLTKSTAGRGNNGKLEAYGIKKLRELIYELAAKGLLVDVASSAAAKTAKIGDVADLVMGQAPPGNECNKDGVGTIFVKTGEFGELYPEVVEWTTKPLKLAKAGDVLICVVGATVGKLNLAIDCAIGRSVAAIRPRRDIDTKYLYFSLMPYTLKLRSQSRGSAQGVIGKEELNAVEIRLPSLKEQHRIVAKVDELMALCDQLEQQQTHSIEALQTLVASLLGTLTRVESQQEFSAAWARIANHFDTLFTTEASIAQLKQTLLQLAVMGKLVPQDPDDPPASQLLKEIEAEKKRLVKEGKIKAPKPLPEIKAEEVPYALPQGWEWVRFFTVNTVQSELVSAKDFPLENQIAPDSIDKGNGLLLFHRTVADCGSIGPNNKFYEGQILYSKIRPSLNKAVIAPYDGLCSADMYPIKAHVDADFMLKVILSEVFLAQVRFAENRIKMPKLNLESLGQFIVPLPPLPEQHRIVAKVDELMALCDTLKARLADAQAIQLHLADAIVEQAVC